MQGNAKVFDYLNQVLKNELTAVNQYFLHARMFKNWGLTKLDELESKDEIKRRISKAAEHMPLEQLALSPQCGFSSTFHGNEIDVQAQADKLALILEIAREVWGEI